MIENRCVSFSERPGLGRAATAPHLGRTRRPPRPLAEVDRGTDRARKTAEPYLDSIAELLTDLAARHNDLRPIELAQAWAGPGATDQRLSLASRVLMRIAVRR
jgi:hypothetical protein